jgi:hypothetical protein
MQEWYGLPWGMGYLGYHTQQYEEPRNKHCRW